MGGGEGADDMAGEVRADEVVLPRRVLVRFRILGRLRTTLVQRKAASTERR